MGKKLLYVFVSKFLNRKALKRDATIFHTFI